MFEISVFDNHMYPNGENSINIRSFISVFTGRHIHTHTKIKTIIEEDSFEGSYSFKLN